MEAECTDIVHLCSDIEDMISLFLLRLLDQLELDADEVLYQLTYDDKLEQVV